VPTTRGRLLPGYVEHLRWLYPIGLLLLLLQNQLFLARAKRVIIVVVGALDELVALVRGQGRGVVRAKGGLRPFFFEGRHLLAVVLVGPIMFRLICRLPPLVSISDQGRLRRHLTLSS